MSINITKNGIFKSIQGEGVFTGHPTLFVRTFGCNSKCDWCDQKESWEDESNSVEYDLDTLALEIQNKVPPLTRHICITGGEPFLQKVSLSMLLSNVSFDKEDFISVETNASIYYPIPEINFYSFSPKLHNWPDHTLLQWIKYCDISKTYYQIKIVCANAYDVNRAVDKIVSMNRKSNPDILSHVFIQPLYPSKDISELVESCLAYGLPLSLQVHKMIGVR